MESRLLKVKEITVFKHWLVLLVQRFETLKHKHSCQLTPEDLTLVKVHTQNSSMQNRVFTQFPLGPEKKKDKIKKKTHKQNFHGTVPGLSWDCPGTFSSSWELCLCASHFPQEEGNTETNLTPTRSRDNPEKLFMFIGFCKAQLKHTAYSSKKEFLAPLSPPPPEIHYVWAFFLYYEEKGCPKHQEFMGSASLETGEGLGGGFLVYVYCQHLYFSHRPSPLLRGRRLSGSWRGSVLSRFSVGLWLFLVIVLGPKLTKT